ncbi:MAG: hypothetical protein LBL39_06715 [Planctomycetaceae bacterium]|jgi:hypothetical protein|nr:hypothetical protein [Planctomycetaceae bacterium]
MKAIICVVVSSFALFVFAPIGIPALILAIFACNEKDPIKANQYSNTSLILNVIILVLAIIGFLIMYLFFYALVSSVRANPIQFSDIFPTITIDSPTPIPPKDDVFAIPASERYRALLLRLNRGEVVGGIEEDTVARLNHDFGDYERFIKKIENGENISDKEIKDRFLFKNNKDIPYSRHTGYSDLQKMGIDYKYLIEELKQKRDKKQAELNSKK